jgi:AcrR family transcriptional regulator
MTAVVARGPGRPRSEAIDSAILDATIEELIERGYLALSVESIAARAGVAKTTVYRRWSNTIDLALAAMRSFESDVQEPPPGSVRDQLVWLTDAMRRKWSDPRYSAMMRRVAADGTAQPELYRQTRDRLIAPHLRQMNRILARGIDEGIIRADADLAWVRQLITAPILSAALTLKERVPLVQVEFSVDTVLRGVAPLAG